MEKFKRRSKVKDFWHRVRLFFGGAALGNSHLIHFGMKLNIFLTPIIYYLFDMMFFPFQPFNMFKTLKVLNRSALGDFGRFLTASIHNTYLGKS